VAAKPGYQTARFRVLSEQHWVKWQFIVCVLALLLLINNAAAEPGQGKTTVDFAVVVTKNISYGPLSEECGDLYLPKGVTKPPPIVVVIHGGVWVSRDRADNVAFSRPLASRGIAAFNIDYRLANPAKPSTRWPAQIIDSQLAVRWLRAKSNELGVDGTRIGALGASSSTIWHELTNNTNVALHVAA
jgi:acetyl esterase/lipase